MKKIFIILIATALFSCHGSESAGNRPTDVDRTKNDDTNAVKKDSLPKAVQDSLDSARRAGVK